MKVYLANISINLKLTMRDRVVLFFNYFLPLAFFFVFAESWDADQSGVITQVVTMVLIIAVLGNGFFGAGMRAVQDREFNILRRFKVAPITPAPLLVSSMVTGWLHFIPASILIVLLAHFLYGMEIPRNWPSLFVLLSLAILSFRAVGLIVASVVNSAQESQILTQLLYMPMLFLSGATFPLAVLPEWLQVVAHFLPATYLYTGMQGILFRDHSLAEIWLPVSGLFVTGSLSLFLCTKLFRWEKTEKVRTSARLWLAAVLAPFVLIGGFQVYSRDNVERAKVLYRDMQRSRTLLIRGARIMTGAGVVIESGAVLIKGGKIAEIHEGEGPDPETLRAEAMDAPGKTILPGLIDAGIHISSPGAANFSWPDERKGMQRALASYLYSGVTAVRSSGDGPAAREVARASEDGSRLGAWLLAGGPVFTSGKGNAGFEGAPGTNIVLRPLAGADDARRQVRELKSIGARYVTAVLPAGVTPAGDSSVFGELGRAAQTEGLLFVVRTAGAGDVAEAMELGAGAIEGGSSRDAIPDAVLREMARRRVFYIPALSAVEAREALHRGSSTLFDRSLVLQVGPAGLIRAARNTLNSGPAVQQAQAPEDAASSLKAGQDNLLRAWRAGVPLAAGSGAGNPLVLHGPAVQREMQLWVEAGIPPEAALQAATRNAAMLLGAGDRIGTIEKGREANLLIVDGNPLRDIAAAERVSVVILRGERIVRSELFGQR